jgi:hypothetical protein
LLSLLPYLCDQPVVTRRFPFLADMAGQAT